jgi:hypothetical protein
MVMERPPDFSGLIRFLLEVLTVTIGVFLFFVVLFAWIA